MDTHSKGDSRDADVGSLNFSAESVASEGGLGEGEHGVVASKDPRLAAAAAKRQAYESMKSGAGGLQPGVHGRLVTDEDFLYQPPALTP